MNAPSTTPPSLAHHPNGNGANGANGRVDLLAISELVTPGSRVLDIGCGDGELLRLLQATRNVDGRGIEISQKGVNECVARGLSVIQGDADSDLVDYPDHAFDFVILSQTLQATRSPRVVIDQMLRIGRRAIVSFPNFGNWRVRASLGFTGRMPVTRSLPYSWYDTPNIHFCTIRDFVALCDELRAIVDQSMVLHRGGQKSVPFGARLWFWNLFGQQAVFLLRR
jgi:methionine biosynthesis protein MetW